MRSIFPLPPPFIAFILVVLMWVCPIWGEYNVNLYVIGVIILLSAAIALSALYQCHHQKTTIDPQKLDNTTYLLTHGIFRFSRNPMYLSLLLCLIAFALWRGNLLCWVGVIGFVIIMNRGQIRREEQFLLAKFGETYRQYQKQVRRWI